MCTHFRTTTQTATNPPLHRRKLVRREYSTPSADLIRFQSVPLNSYRFTMIYHKLSTGYPRLIHNLSTVLRELSTGYPHVIHNLPQKRSNPFPPLTPLSLDFILLYCYIVIHCYILLYYYIIMLYYIVGYIGYIRYTGYTGYTGYIGYI